MLAAVGMFVLGLLLLALGGDSIVKGASGLAQRLGLTPFTTGLLLVAFAAFKIFGVMPAGAAFALIGVAIEARG